MRLKEKIGNLLLQKKLKHKPGRKTSFLGIGKSEQLGIVFDATEYDDFKTAKAFEKELRFKGKKVTLLGYQHAKALHSQYITDLNTGFICRKDFNWLNMCQHRFVSEFVSKQFDILIILAPKDLFPFHYVSLLSEAKFKVGRRGIYQSDLDLMLEITENTSIGDQIMQVWRYLEMISKPNEKLHEIKN